MRLSIRFAGYQPPGSIHTKAAQVFGSTLSRRLGDTIQFEFDNDITTSGHQASYTVWPDDVRQAVVAAATAATNAQRGYAAAEDEKVLGKLHPERNEIIHLTEAERTRFIQVVAPLIEEQRSALGADLFTHLDRLTA